MNTTGTFSVGDRVRVATKIKEGNKERVQNFDGMVLAIRGRGENKTFTVRRLAVGNIAVERIWPLTSPIISSVTVVKKADKLRRSKLYYVRSRTTAKSLAKI